MYVLRAIDDDDREVRVVVDARYGEIVSITPIVTASRDVPLRELPPRRMAPYERAPDGYDRPGYRSGPPIVYESDPPLERPRAIVPDDPRHAGRALPPPGRGEPPPVIYSDRSPDEIERRPMPSPRPIARGTPQASIDTDAAPGAPGLLPPPPDRFPQRVAPPAAKPVPKRAAAAPPTLAPLPKPRPTDGAQVDPAPPPAQAASSPPTPERKPAADQMPH
jgi:hypothetical protein